MPDDLSLDGLPDDTVNYIKSLRQEAARYRTERNEIKTKYEDAGTLLATANSKLDEFSAMETQLETTVNQQTELQTNFDKLRAAAKFGIPEEVDRLKGSKYEEWEADAESLAVKLGNRKPTITKDAAATEKPKPPKSDPITEAFRKEGWL